MKASKIFITSLVVAGTILTAGTTFADASPNTITLDSILKSTTDNTSSSIWNDLVKSDGTVKTATEVKNSEGSNYYGADRGDKSYLVGNGLNNKKSVSLSSLYGYQNSYSSGSYQLTSFSYIVRDTGSGTASIPDNCVVQIKNGTTVVATSQIITGTAPGNTYGIGTANFASGIFLDWNTQYTFDFVDATNNSTAKSVGQGLFTAKDGWTIDGVSGTSAWNSAIRFTLTEVPEPSSFGVLAGLGALALVGARRRRKI